MAKVTFDQWKENVTWNGVRLGEDESADEEMYQNYSTKYDDADAAAQKEMNVSHGFSKFNVDAKDAVLDWEGKPEGPGEWEAPEKPSYTPQLGGATTVDEFGYGKTAVAGQPVLPTPLTIPAPDQRAVKPEELVEHRLTEFMKESNPFTQMAITQSKQQSIAAGQFNTSMMIDSGLYLAAKVGLDVVRDDAAWIRAQKLENQRAANNFLFEDWKTKNQFTLTDYGARITTYNQALEKAHTKNENALERYWKKEQNRLDRELTVWRDRYKGSLEKWLADKEYTADETSGMKDCVENALQRWQTAVSAIDLEYTKDEMSVDAYNHAINSASQMRDREVSACRL